MLEDYSVDASKKRRTEVYAVRVRGVEKYHLGAGIQTESITLRNELMYAAHS